MRLSITHTNSRVQTQLAGLSVCEAQYRTSVDLETRVLNDDVSCDPALRGLFWNLRCPMPETCSRSPAKFLGDHSWLVWLSHIHPASGTRVALRMPPECGCRAPSSAPRALNAENALKMHRSRPLLRLPAGCSRPRRVTSVKALVLNVTSPKGLHGWKHRFAVNRALRAGLQGRQAPSRWDLEE